MGELRSAFRLQDRQANGQHHSSVEPDRSQPPFGGKPPLSQPQKGRQELQEPNQTATSRTLRLLDELPAIHIQVGTPDEYPGIKHPRSLSVREDNLLPTIDGWLGQLFDDNHVDDTIETMAAIDLENTGNIEESEARQTIKDCDKRIANFEIACGASDDPDTIAGFARRIESTRSERKGAEARLRRATTGRGLTEDEIREVVQSLASAISLLTNASPEDRRRVYEAARLEILYDHETNRAQLSVAPRVTGGVGGAFRTLTPQAESDWIEFDSAA